MSVKKPRVQSNVPEAPTIDAWMAALGVAEKCGPVRLGMTTQEIAEFMGVSRTTGFVLWFDQGNWVF
jgi:hypothetical protein